MAEAVRVGEVAMAERVDGLVDVVAMEALVEQVVKAAGEAVGERAVVEPNRNSASGHPENAPHRPQHRSSPRHNSTSPCLLCCPTPCNHSEATHPRHC